MSGGCAWPVNCRVKRPREPSKASQTWPIYILSRGHSLNAFPHLQSSKILKLVKIHDLSSFFFRNIDFFLFSRERVEFFVSERLQRVLLTEIGMAVNEQRDNLIVTIQVLRVSFKYLLFTSFLFIFSLLVASVRSVRKSGIGIYRFIMQDFFLLSTIKYLLYSVN